MRLLRIGVLLLISAILLTCIESTIRVYDNDLWFHLGYGKHFVENLTWSIDHSSFSWTPTKEWTYVTWIGSSAMYVTYNFFSINAVMLLPFLNLISILLLYVFFLRSIGSSYSFMTMALFFIAAFFFYLPVVKPAVVTTFMFAACLAIYYSSRNNRNRAYWAYPLFFLFWVNTHGGFIFGLFFLSFAFAIEFILAWRKKTLQFGKAYLQGFGTALILSFLILGINPEGYGYLTSLVQQIFLVDTLNPATHITEFIDLWSFMDPTKDLSPGLVGVSWAGVLMLASYALLALVGIKMGRRPDIVSILSLIIFFFMGMLMVRLFVFYSLVWLFSMTWLIATERPIRYSGRLTLAALAIMFYFAANQVNIYVLDGNTIRPFEYNIDEQYPIKASAFISENRLPDPIINGYVLGGYMIWANYPEHKVFVDPRYWPYRQDVIEDCFFLERADTAAKVTAILNKYPQTQTIYLEMRFLDSIIVLLNMNAWKLIYFDHKAAIFVQASSPEGSLNADYNAGRFVEIKSPRILEQLFKFYLARKDFSNARTLRDSYKRNVPNSYLWKTMNSSFMDIQLK